MRPNNRQRSRGGRNGGGGGNHNHKPQHNHNPNRPPNRNQIFDSSGPDVRVRGNAHQVFDKYQALAREAAAVGDRIQAEAYFQYADHYYRVIQTQGGFINRGQGWNDGGEDSQNPQQQDGQSPPQQSNGGAANGEGYAQNDRQNDRPNDRQNDRQGGDRQNDRQGSERQNERPENQNVRSEHQSNRPEQQRNSRSEQQNVEPDAEPGLGGVAFLQSGRSAPANQDPAAEDQPEVPEFRPSGRRS
jgi:Domain of unknown function (DUF4167)